MMHYTIAQAYEYYKAKKDDQVIAKAKKSIDEYAKPEAASYQYIGFGYLGLGKEDEAIRYWKEGLSKYANDKNMMEALSYVYDIKGGRYYGLKAWANAYKNFQESYKYNGSNLNALKYWAFSAYSMKRDKEAWQLLEDLVKKDPKQYQSVKQYLDYLRSVYK